MAEPSDFASQLMDGLRKFFGGGKVPYSPPLPEGKTRGPVSRAKTATTSTGPVSSKQTLPLDQQELTPEEKAAESKKRMGFIIAYMKAPESVPEFKDPRFVYKIVTDERTHQTELIEELQAEVKAISLGAKGSPQDPALVAEREDLERRIDAARERLSQLFLILKRVTGTRGKTGGTDFLPSLDSQDRT